jgi:putative tricarboxylic transport membrane protein
VQRVDRLVGTAIALFALAVLWTARRFPDVPGQTLGASTLPMIVGGCLLACGLLLVWRSRSAGRYAAGDAVARDAPRERIAPAMGILAAIAVYLALADTLGYLLVAPVTLLIALLSLRVRPLPAIGWAIAATLAVHLAFYKLLKVPLPWGLLPPLY